MPVGQPLFTATFPLLHDSLHARHLSLPLLRCSSSLIKVGKAHRGSIQRQGDRGDYLYSVDALLQGLLIDGGEWRSTHNMMKEGQS